MARAERGVALLEVLIALAVLGAAALATVGALMQGAAAAGHSESTERRIEDESRLLSAVTLLTRDDLERRLGPRTAGAYSVEIARISPTLYRISVGSGGFRSPPDLVTLVTRAEPGR